MGGAGRYAPPEKGRIGMNIFRTVFDLLFPPQCVFCRKILARGEKDVCAACRSSLPLTGGRSLTEREDYGRCIAPVYYRDTVRKAFHRFKFKGKVRYATVFGRMMADAIRAHYSGAYDLITWVPVSARRKQSRGYDQAMLLAYAVALELDDIALETLRKPMDVRSQSEIDDAAERKKNIAGAFELIDPELVAGKRVLLIDDVLTTGATLGEIAGMLRAAGAADVMCAVFARAREGASQKRPDAAIAAP